MRVTLLVDNEAASDVLRSEHGLSFLVETDDVSVLFDTGQTDAWLHNLIALGRDPDAIKVAAISHGHYDHTGGLVKAIQELSDAAYYAHPECFQPKYARTNDELRYIGTAVEVVSQKGVFTLNRSPVEILPGVILSGEIPLKMEMHSSDSKFWAGGDNPVRDTFEDEQCVIIRNNGLTAVLVGCAHRGLENNVLAAMAVVGTTRIDLLAGGFHLADAGEDRLESLADFLERVNVGHIACCHCTGANAFEYLRSKLGSRVAQALAGVTWEI
jgi:7,8-dihydropterin-6-yl-methyl-4-(beta-D-ribofuranosyl)aminobenzene 5'-phosphate synthase